MKFKKLKVLGKGSYGKVYLVEDDKTKDMYALKKIDKDKDSYISFNTEVNLLKNIDHNNIIKLYDFYENDFSLNIVLEYAEKGTLYNIIEKGKRINKKFQNKEINNIISSISNGLEYLHERNIIHRDIKPENILVTKNDIFKLADFGVSRIDNKTKLIQTSIGTPYYMAPEIIKGRPYTTLIDCWSLGIILFEIINLRLPFMGENMYILSSRICRGYISIYSIPQQYKKLVQGLICIDAYRRFTIKDVLKYLENINLQINKNQNCNKPVNNVPRSNYYNYYHNYAKNYISPYRQADKKEINKNVVLPPINNNDNNYRKRKPNSYMKKDEALKYWQNRKPFFF